MDQISTPDYEFEGFRLDTALQTLFSRDGQPVPLPSRAFDTLKYLVERSGELVDKSALMKAVWPKAIVEENNLSQCIATLRRVLGEAAGERRFILTVPGRGFKFVAPVNVVPRARFDAAPEPPAVNVSGRQYRPALGVAAAISALFLAAAGWWVLGRTRPVTVPAEYEALTDVTDIATAPVLSPDGHMLAYIRGDGPFLSAGQIWLKLLPDGEARQLTHYTGLMFAPTFAPDGARVAYTAVSDPANLSWDTYTVPITGGESTLLLPNASGLSFIGAHEVLFSEFKTGVHLGIVSSLDDRSRHRDIYLPEHERGMAHYSSLSPDRRSVLVVEMDRTGAFRRCRLLPFDGSSAGAPVGPDGDCIAAAWSPDGRWMYFSAAVAGQWHLWRQRFPDGPSEQITFGPTTETTVAVAPDGRSLLTSLGRSQSQLWFKDPSGRHALTDERPAFSPLLSGDGRRVYFLSAGAEKDPPQLWRLEVATGRKEALLTGFAIGRYDISYDEGQVVFSVQRAGRPQIWIASLDRHEPPRLLVQGGDECAFDATGNVYFRHVDANANFLHRVHADGSGEEELIHSPILEFYAVAPDGGWVSVDKPLEGGIGAGWLQPLRAGQPRLLRKGWWPSHWSRDGKHLFVEVGFGDTQRHGRTAVFEVGASGVPDGALDAGGEREVLIQQEEMKLSISDDPSVYVYEEDEVRRNIYRIPLHL